MPRQNIVTLHLFNFNVFHVIFACNFLMRFKFMCLYYVSVAYKRHAFVASCYKGSRQEMIKCVCGCRLPMDS